MSSLTASDDFAFYAAAARRAPKLERLEEIELAKRWQGGDRTAANTLARAHLRHVVALALKYRHYGLPLGELVAEGNFGVVHALGRFEPERGVRFGTYANYWVRAFMLSHVMRSWSNVGGGSGSMRSQVFFKLRRERVRVTNLLGVGEAADQMLAARLGVTLERVQAMVQRLERRDVSFDAPRVPGARPTLLERLPAPDDQEQTFFEAQVGGSMRTAVNRAVSELDARERYIAERRLMADPGDELSLADIGRALGVSRERARQLEERAKRKLRDAICAEDNPIVSEWLSHEVSPPGARLPFLASA